MNCALLEQLAANLVLYMLITDDATELANYQRAYCNLQIKISERVNPNFARQIVFDSRRLEPQQRNSKRIHRNYQPLNKLAVCYL